MKKIVCILLTLVMVMSLSVVAFADSPETISDSTGSKDITVTGTITKDTEVGKSAAKYEITIEWNISYSENGTKIQKTSGYTWNPTTYKYELESTGATYESTQTDTIGGTIKVTNKSNADIGYTIAWTDDSGITSKGVTVTESGTGDKTGTLDRADKAFKNVSAVDDDYNITPGNLASITGAETSATYTIDLSWTAEDYSAVYNDNSITLGKYTVTIGQPEA